MSPTLDRVPTTPQASLIAELDLLLDQSLWANRRWVEFVHAQPDAERRPRELLGHIMAAERIWLERILGERKTTDAFPVLEKDELLRALDENRATCASLIATRLDQVFHFRRATGEEGDARVIDVIHHLVTHGYHHRGQLASHYAHKGVVYPATDHIDFVMARSAGGGSAKPAG